MALRVFQLPLWSGSTLQRPQSKAFHPHLLDRGSCAFRREKLDEAFGVPEILSAFHHSGGEYLVDFARSRVCLKAFTVLISGRGVPVRTPTPSGTRARSTSEPVMILPSANSWASPSLDRMTTSAGTPRRS